MNSWAYSKFQNDELKKVDNYTARLIKFDEIPKEVTSSCSAGKCENIYTAIYEWMYNHNYWYDWTMTSFSQDDGESSSSNVWTIWNSGSISSEFVESDYAGNCSGTLRPVINVYKQFIN